MYKPASEHFTDYILIRAPVWGAIADASLSALATSILIRAPVWGAISVSSSVKNIDLSF